MKLYNHKVAEGDNNLFNVPNMLLQKTPSDEFVATTHLTVAAKGEQQMGGLIMMGLDYSALVVCRVGDEFQLQQRTCKGADKNKKEEVQVLATLKATDADKYNYEPAIYCDVYLRLQVKKGGEMTFSYSMNGKKYTSVGQMFKMREGKWIGAKIGLVAAQPAGKAVKGFANVDWFRVTKK